MNYLKKILSHKATKLVATVFIGGSLMFGGNTSAAPSTSDMNAFKEAYLAVPSDTRIFNQHFTLFTNKVHAESNAYGQILRDATMNIKGTIEWTYTNDMASDEKTVPFYLEQTDKDMIFYANRNGRWSKISLPGFPFGLTNALKTTSINVLRENMTAVKDVKVTNDTDTQRVMEITLDGKILSNLVSKYSQQNFTNMTDENKETQQDFLNTIERALQKTDLNFTWTVDKKNWETITTSGDLTPLMREYCKQVLQDAADGKFELSMQDRELMESLGYFSELHYFTTLANPKTNFDISLPNGAESAVENDKVLDDLVYEINSAVQK